MASVELRGLTKKYGALAVVDNVSLLIEHGTLVCLLGPSGCGKTTTLRLAAGFVEPTEGEIRVGDRVVSSPQKTLPPERRNMSMIFQSYALWPHMTVAENIVYGLKLRKVDSATIKKKLDDILATTRLAPLAQRYPGELSGGQQQRVALARAMAPRPPLILLDEPFGALDASLRSGLRRDVRQALKEDGATAVLVTHDQSEALSMADRAAVMRAGRLRQLGTPDEVYAHPADAWVAAFVGEASLLPLLDVVLGLMLFVRPWTGRVAIFMCLATVGYLTAATLSLPHLWIDPLGPWLKVLPMMALCLFVAATDARR